MNYYLNHYKQLKYEKCACILCGKLHDALPDHRLCISCSPIIIKSYCSKQSNMCQKLSPNDCIECISSNKDFMRKIIKLDKLQ